MLFLLTLKTYNDVGQKAVDTTLFFLTILSIKATAWKLNSRGNPGPAAAFIARPFQSPHPGIAIRAVFFALFDTHPIWRLRQKVRFTGTRDCMDTLVS